MTTAETSYSRQGEEQPFGYTGYRYDDISSTYFAQAREYQPKTGRFTAEDIIKGNGLIPETLNPYVYCWNSPLGLVDLDGRSALLAILVVAGGSLLLGGCGKKEQPITVPETTSSEEIETLILQEENEPSILKNNIVPIQNYITVSEYNVEERYEFIEFMKYAESAGNFNGNLHDSNGDGILDTIGYGHDVEKNGDIDLYINRTLTEEEGEALLIEDLKARVPETWIKYMEDKGHQFTANEIDALTSLVYAVGMHGDQ